MSVDKKKLRPSLLIKGLLIGTADIIPGISGGTVALIVGIYHELVRSIHDIGLKTILAPFMLFSGAKRPEAIGELKAINWGFLIPVGLGVVSGVLVMSRVIPQFLDEYPLAMYSLFFGLILASVIFPWRLVDSRKRDYAYALAGGLFAYVLLGLGQFDQGSLNPLWVFFTGSIAITAMILPGISGAYILVLLGQYQTMLTAIHERRIVTIAVFVMGIAVGILMFARVLNWLLDHYRSATMAVLTGFMIGSLRSVWPGQHFIPSLSTNTQLYVSAFFTVIGIALVLTLDYFSKPKDKENY